MTELVGRNGELDRALAHLSSHGRVVVVGPGGIGKTSLALTLADRLAPERVVVDADVLGGLSVIESLAVDRVGGPRFGDDPADVLAMRTQRRRLALVVDGADGVVDEVLRMADDVPVGGDGPWVIVTSRVHPAMWTWPVIRLGPLPLTATDRPSPAATLFRRRYHAAGGDDDVLHTAADRVERVLADTGGVPLAIEVAAARAAVAGFAFPGTGGTASGADAVVAESLRRSLDDLPPHAVELFTALGVTSSRFPVSFAAALVDLPEARTVELLELLARHSLVHPQADGYAMLPPIHRHAARLAGSDHDAARRHRSWCLAQARTCETAAEAAKLVAVAVDLRLAIDRAVTAADSKSAFAMTVALEGAYRLTMQHRQRVELLDATLSGLTMTAGTRRERAELYRRLGIAHADTTGLSAALACFHQAEEILGDVPADDPLLVGIRRIQAACRADAGDPGGAVHVLLDVADMSARHGDTTAELHARRFAANALLELGRLDEADEQATRVVDGAGDVEPALRQLGLDSKAMIALERGDRATCEALGRRLATDPVDGSRRMDGEYLMLVADPTTHAHRPVWTEARSEGQNRAAAFEILAELGRAIRLLVAGDAAQALATATDVAVAAEEWRLWAKLDALLLAGDAAVVAGDLRQAALCFRTVLVDASRHGYALRVPDALEGLAHVRSGPAARQAAATARALRRHHGAAPRPRPWLPEIDPGTVAPAGSWIVDGRLSSKGIEHFTSIDDTASTTTPLDALSPAERRVATLVAEGCTNREIAERLHIGRRTVETHILHAFQKLSVTNRTQLAMVATSTSI